jgi:hypothetical protein
LIGSISQLYPQIFYKPLFQCAASTKEFAVINYLCIITTLASYLPDFWTRDAEMVAVALMSNGPTSKHTSQTSLEWTQVRLGQLVLFVEVIHQIQTLRRVKEEFLVSLVLNHALSWFDEKQQQAENTLTTAIRFAASLEARIGVFLEAQVLF